jgi:hypothetical protein
VTTDSKKAEKKKKDAAEAKDMAFTDITTPGHKKGSFAVDSARC